MAPFIFRNPIQHLNYLAMNLALVVPCFLVGCSPQRYRINADCETQDVIAEKASLVTAFLPESNLYRDPRSRVYDPQDPDQPPLPPDDPMAHEYLHCVNGHTGYRGWHDCGDADEIEASQWRQFLPLNDRGQLEADAAQCFRLAVLHSREYQSQLEVLYLAALDLTLERFEFDVQWFGRHSLFYTHFGRSSRPFERNELTADNQIGLGKALPAGGQLLVNFANQFMWEFTGSDVNFASSSFGIDFIQPLLRRAAREVRLESLTQRERDVLYAVRDFVRFRRRLYTEIVAGENGYLELLAQQKIIENLEENLGKVQASLNEHEALSRAGIVSSVQVDQVSQAYQVSRLAVILAQTRLDNSLDAFKIRIGLPPTVNLVLDDRELEPFRLTHEDLTRLEVKAGRIALLLRTPDSPPDTPALRQTLARLEEVRQRAQEQAQDLAQEIRVQVRPHRTRISDDRTESSFRDDTARLQQRLADIDVTLRQIELDLRNATNDLKTGRTNADSWLDVQGISQRLAAVVGDQVLLQTQIRVNVPQLSDETFDADAALQFALDSRLDLQNQRAEVVDNWRRIRVAADGLEADLDVILSGDIGTTGDNPLKFSSSSSTYRVGFRLDSPLNRKAERNFYRASIIEYQRSRRSFMALTDTIAQEIRRRIRLLEADRLNFQIARQRLLVATRQVRGAQLQLTAPGAAADASLTIFVLEALNSQIQAKNELVNAWARYQAGRIQLMLSMEALNLDSTDGVSYEYEPGSVVVLPPESDDPSHLESLTEPRPEQP